MFTGSAPFRGETPLDVLMRQVNEPPTPPRAVSPELPQHIERALLKALSKDPGGRWPSATLFVEAIRGRVDASHVQTISLGGHLSTLGLTGPGAPATPAAAVPAATPKRTPSRLRRLGLFTLVALTLGGAVLLGLWRYAASLQATPSSPHPPAPDMVEFLTAGARRALDEGDYPAALKFAALALRLNPDSGGAKELNERVRKAWDAERSLGLWEPSPGPSPAR